MSKIIFSLVLLATISGAQANSCTINLDIQNGGCTSGPSDPSSKYYSTKLTKALKALGYKVVDTLAEYNLEYKAGDTDCSTIASSTNIGPNLLKASVVLGRGAEVLKRGQNIATTMTVNANAEAPYKRLVDQTAKKLSKVIPACK